MGTLLSAGRTWDLTGGTLGKAWASGLPTTPKGHAALGGPSSLAPTPTTLLTKSPIELKITIPFEFKGFKL